MINDDSNHGPMDREGHNKELMFYEWIYMENITNFKKFLSKMIRLKLVKMVSTEKVVQRLRKNLVDSSIC